MRVKTSRMTVNRLKYEARADGLPIVALTGEGETRCLSPVVRLIDGAPDPVTVALGIEADRKAFTEGWYRCRKCEACLRHRARLWTARAIAETKASTRTWFGTLTLSPANQTRFRYMAINALEKGQVERDEDSVFRKTVEIVGQEITLFLKRCRKVARFRILLVTEKHKTGLPHFHILIHEHGSQIGKRALEAQWRLGFSHWRLIPLGDERMCGYVCKYLSKSILTRVRASARYGQGAMQLVTERLEEVTREGVSAIAAALTRKEGTVGRRDGEERESVTPRNPASQSGIATEEFC